VLADRAQHGLDAAIAGPGGDHYTDAPALRFSILGSRFSFHNSHPCGCTAH
jgi:hypothetical protein